MLENTANLYRHSGYDCHQMDTNPESCKRDVEQKNGGNFNG